MGKEIRPVRQRVGRGDNPDKIMVVNREVGRATRQPQDMSDTTRAVRDGVSGLAQPEGGAVTPDAQLAWKQRRATTLMRRAFTSTGKARAVYVEGLPDMISALADQKDPSKESNVMTRFSMWMNKRSKAGKRRGVLTFPKDWDEVREQMVEELQAKGRDAEAQEILSSDEAGLYRRYTDPRAKQVVVKTLLAMDEGQAERLRDALDKLGLKP